MTVGKKKLSQTAELVAFEISIKSLLCLYNTSDCNGVTNMLLKRKLDVQLFFKSDFDSSALIDILRDLVHVYNLPNELCCQRSEILSMTHCEEFLECIKKYLYGVKKIPKNRAKLIEDIKFIIWFIDVNVNEIPISDVYYNKFYALLKVVEVTLQNSGFQNEAVVKWINELKLLIENKIVHIDRLNTVWKNISIYPHPVDVFERKDLIPNKTFGAYRDISEYLDIHFKLLKEDFESNLREGLLQFKATQRGATIEIPELYIYNQVWVESLEIDKNAKNGVLHKIIIPVQIEEKANDTFKFFLNGSLLLFSEYSQFSTFILATVVEVIELPEGQRKICKALKVSVIGDPSQLMVGHSYTTVEPKTFFEPYHQVLKAIQFLDPQHFPMKKNIIYADMSPSLPRYININTVYSFIDRKLKLFEKWPYNLLNLNQQQLEALQASLTHEFILIQGPPGTGKTYLAEVIIQILIENKHFRSTPILLISSKNDSVDRILEPLAERGRKVVRLGGQSKSAVLKKCTIFNVIKRFGGKEVKERVNYIKETIVSKLNANQTIEEELKVFNREQRSFLEFCDSEDARLLLSANVEIIGGTTAGCARLRCMLDKLQPEIIIVEDANEILESHVVASLSKGCKHIILFGDPKQLQPIVANKSSSEKYNLDVSLFERMSRCGMKCCTLTEQRRMRPEIASLISPLIYPNLENHSGVSYSPDIKGMGKNLFFIDHEVAEEKAIDSQFSQSFCNKYEADILLALADYLVKQGYSTSDITVLLPYTAQQHYMRQAAKNIPSLHNLEIQIIDTYSGQENMIILLSLVRSQSSTIGFLSSNNRVNVALSRAKYGLYIIGNMKTLADCSQLWSSLNDVLKQQNSIGRSLELKCQNHQTITTVSSKEDFKNIYAGGCHLTCKSQLKCGHLCKLMCHPLEERHLTYSCREPCKRLCQRKLHKCKKKCHEECGPCQEMLQRLLDCGHYASIHCCDNGDEYVCLYPTEVVFLCFSRLNVPCYEANSCFYSRVEH